MKPARLFISLRVALASVITLLILLALGDLWSVVAPGLVRVATWFQFLPSVIRALTAFGFLSVGFLLVIGLTLIFGRVYCSFLCPLGAFMDATISLRKRISPKKFVRKNPGYLRYAVLGGVVVSLFAGSMLLVNVLDPYSIFTRTGQAALRPMVIGLNNTLAYIGEVAGYYGISSYTLKTFSLPVLGAILAWLILIVWMAVRHGRLYCNTLCPVGAFLGLVSRVSVLKISIAPDKCVNCGICERTCKASCMDYEKHSVDVSRCVMCLDCLDVCPKEAVSLGGRISSKAYQDTDLARRAFLAVAALFVTGIPGRAQAEGGGNISPDTNTGDPSRPVADTTPLEPPRPIQRDFTLVPPGGKGRDHFTSACTACNLCVAACPSQVIVPGLVSYKGRGLLMPGLLYKKGFCNYNCNACTQVCPSGAILPAGVEEKKRIQIGQAQFIKQNCVVTTHRTECVACAEHCPTGAVKIIREGGGPGLPKVDSEVCVGCGACEFACPARPHKAIYVKASQTHGTALPPQKGESVQNKVNEDFPF